MKEILAIDNGLNGGLVHLDSRGKIIGRMVMPTKVEDGRNRVDECELYKVAMELGMHVTVVLEKPVGSQSVQAATSMADSYARTLTAFRLAGFEVLPIAPRTWQKEVFAKVTGEDTKVKAAKVFRAIFPEKVEEFSQTKKGNKSKNIHDGLVDAALIALYAQRTNYE